MPLGCGDAALPSGDVSSPDTYRFLNAARDVFIMIDKDDSGTLTKEEILRAVKEDDEVHLRSG